MGVVEDVLDIGKKLDKMVAEESLKTELALDMLKRLQDLPITLDVLQKTRIGMTVNALRKQTAQEELTAISKSLIKSWKRLLSPAGIPKDKSRKPEDDDEDSKAYSGDEKMTSSDNNSNQNSGRNSPETQGAQLQDKPVVFSDELPEALQSQDPVRLKCRQLLVAALKTEPQPEDVKNHEVVAAHIEDCIYTEFTSTDTKYKNRIRSRISNLKDSKNPNLRERVLMGDIPPERIATMTTEEMASDELKSLRKKLTKEAIDDHQMAKNEGTKTDLIKCKKCNQYNCSYNQLQTRSSDEPMTTFCYCNACGFRWKFC